MTARVLRHDRLPLTEVGSVALATIVLATAAAAAPPTIDQRLDRLADALEQRRVELHVPGMALAVVKDDEVILSRGFGLADVERERPATDETLFAVGSTTKAFTATLIAMLVDEERMGWDDPVRRHLPWLHLAIERADEPVVVRDLLSHRIGMASMTLLWFGNDVSSREVLDAYCRAEPLYGFRERFNYSNLGFLAAGMASGSAAGTDWETLLRQRLIGPLGMHATNTSIAEAQADPRMAVGYLWDDDEDRLVVHPMRDVATVAPAGAINSNVRDMVQWVRLQLGRGAIDGTRLVSEKQHAETWTPHIEVGDGGQYGLGWFLREWRGRRLIEHAGGIDGFTAKVALLPDDGIGFVLLTNLFATPLGEISQNLVFDALLGEWRDEPSGPQEDLAPLLGTYVGDFGQFDNADFEVLVQNGRLAVDVPGQMVFELDPPNEEGRRPFALTDAIAVRFDRGDGDQARALIIEQAGMTFELPRKGVELPVEIDLEAARAYVGRYQTEPAEDGPRRTVEVLIRRNRLAIDVPGQMAYELHAPDGEGRWVFRVRDSLWARFERNGDEAVTLVMVQDGNETPMTRVAGDSTIELPAATELMATVHRAHGAEHLGELTSIRATGTVTFTHMGIEGAATVICADGLRHRNVLELGRFGRLRSACDGTRGWADNPFRGVEEKHGEALGQLRRAHPLLLLDDWTAHYAQVQVTGRELVDGRNVIVARLLPEAGPSETLLVDEATGLIVELRQTPSSESGMRVPVTQRFEDYRPVLGVLLPFRTIVSNPISGEIVTEYDKVETNVELSEGVFTL